MFIIYYIICEILQYQCDNFGPIFENLLYTESVGDHKLRFDEI
jgi:hypothetical protein